MRSGNSWGFEYQGVLSLNGIGIRRVEYPKGAFHQMRMTAGQSACFTRRDKTLRSILLRLCPMAFQGNGNGNGNGALADEAMRLH
jgi:hypothetical protein